MRGRNSIGWGVLALAASGMLAQAVTSGCAGDAGLRRGRSATHGNRPEALRALDPEALLERGHRLYGQHCEACHGARGAGDGELSPFLSPAPRDFADGRFKLVSSVDGAPFDRDFVEMLRRGMPGSSMPSYAWLEEADLWGLSAVVRELAVEGSAARLQGADEEPGAIGAAASLALATELMTPTDALAVPAHVPPDGDVLARGKVLFLQQCSDCHGLTGQGRPQHPVWDEDGSVNRARDFTAGFLKGGASFEDVVHRIRSGMPGTAMPSHELAADDLAAVAHYVRSLIPAGAEDALVQRREHVRAARVSELPEGPDAMAWQDASRTKVTLAPLSWEDESVTAVSVAAVHDGERVALRLSWPDRTHDGGSDIEAGNVDACAVQLASEPGVPLTGMGSALHPTTILHWRAAWPEDAEAFLSGIRPHGRAARSTDGAVLDAPHYVPLPPEHSQEARGHESVGPGRLVDDTAASVGVAASARWSDDAWRVQFVLDAARFRSEAGAARTLEASFAVWNGAAGDHGPRKAISIWQVLELLP